MTLPTICPLCSASSGMLRSVTSHVFGDKNKNHAFYQCTDCDVFFMHPGLSLEEEKHFYASEFESFMSTRSGSSGGWQKVDEHINANEKTFKRRMKYIEPHLHESASILEVGCSSGFMMFPLINKGHDCTGIEPSGAFSDYLKSKNVKVFSSIDDLKIARSEKKYDLIMHFFVLEHITQPLEFLKNQISLLNDNGKIIFEIPNAADPLYSIYDIPAFERFYWSIAHPWYFNEKSMNYLLGKLGYKYQLLKEQRYDLSNHMVWARDGKPGGMNRFTEKFGLEIEELYKKALIESGHCDTLVGIIEKI